MLADLTIFKKHVRADDFTEDDELLAFYLKAATDCVVNATGYTLDELERIPSAEFPDAIREAIYMRGASMYAYKEDVDSATLGVLPFSLQAIVKPYCKMYGGGRLEALVEKYKDAEPQPDEKDDEGGSSDADAADDADGFSNSNGEEGEG